MGIERLLAFKFLHIVLPDRQKVTGVDADTHFSYLQFNNLKQYVGTVVFLMVRSFIRPTKSLPQSISIDLMMEEFAFFILQMILPAKIHGLLSLTY